jgi:hypothetical protein
MERKHVSFHDKRCKIPDTPGTNLRDTGEFDGFGVKRPVSPIQERMCRANLLQKQGRGDSSAEWIE